MSKKGFTLMELLVVMTIVAILAGIVVPQYNAYKARAFDLRARADLTSLALAQEGYFIDSERYLPCSGDGCRGLPGFARPSAGVSISATLAGDGFEARSKHSRGTGKEFVWKSMDGGLQ
jgi:prepilin-type N-terminal cleavage/methylation domain-containing protein